MHVPKEYDYRYSQANYRKEIIKAIVLARERTTRKNAFRFYFTDDINLTDYVNTEQISKNGDAKEPELEF